jgi:hypothetical protein
MWFLFVQFLGLVPSVIAFTSLQSGSRRRILALQVLCCILWLIHYALLGAATGIAINVLGLFRAVVCACNDKKWASSKLWLVLFLVCYAASPFLTWDGPYCLLIGAAMMLTTGALWTSKMRLTRLLYLCNSPLVLIYNLCAHSYSCALIEVAALISYLIAVWRFDLRRQRADEGPAR